MQWTKKDLPFSVQNKPTEIVNKGLAAANKALLNGKSKVEATLVALGTIRAIEQALNPVVEPVVPSHISLLKAQEEPKNVIHRAFLGKNALPTDSDRVLVSADFNESAQLVLVFDTGETLTTKSIITEEILQQYLTVTTDTEIEVGIEEIQGLSINTPQDNEVLVYEQSTGLWKNKSLSSEGDEVLAKRTDFVGETLIYKGEAAVGTTNSASLWRIRLMTISVDGDISETWASGNANYDKVWDDRLTYTYS